MKTLIFPYFLYRVSGGPIGELAKLNVGEVSDLVAKSLLHDRQIGALQTKLCNQLYKTISTTQDKHKRLELINLKREISAGKEVHNMHKFNNLLLVKYSRLLGIRSQIIQDMHTKYSKQVQNSRGTLNELIRNETFQNGIAYSSKPLFEYIRQVIVTNRESTTITKHDIGLIKYLSRFYSKTSPLSSFASVGYGLLRTGENRKVNFASNSKRSIISLNNAAVDRIQQLLYFIPDLANNLPLTVNNTVREDTNHYVFLANYNNSDAVQRVQKSTAVGIILKLVHESSTSTTNLARACVENKTFSDSPDQIERYIRKLVSIGLLGYSLPPLTKLRRYLVNDGLDMKVKALNTVFSKIDNFLSNSKPGDSESLMTVISDLYSQYDLTYKGIVQQALNHNTDVCAFSNQSLKGNHPNKRLISEIFTRPLKEHPLSQEKLFYEDVILTKQSWIRNDKVISLIKSLSEFITPLLLAGPTSRGQQIMHHIYSTRFKLENEVPLIDFFEECIKYTNTRSPNNYHKSDVNALFRAIARKILKDAVPNCNSINITTSQWNKVQPPLDLHHHSLHISLSAYVQLYFSGSKPYVVLNDLNLGYGKSFGRFLPYFDKKLTNEIIKNNNGLTNDIIAAENNDASVFNANTHPVLLPYEIDIPGSKPHLSPNRRIHLTDITVAQSKDKNSLILKDIKSNKQVVIFDLGFEGERSRSTMFKFLNQFCPISDLQDIENLHKYLHWKSNNCIVHYPQISFDKYLIVWREMWCIRRYSIPIKHIGESDSDYFININKWRLSNQIPQNVFVRLVNEKIGEKISAKAVKYYSQDDYKPQYIDFSNPYLVKLFCKLASKALNNLWIEHMLPTPDKMLKFNNRSYATEFIFQWNT